MSNFLKSMIQDLINDRTEQAQIAIHQYIVSKTQQIAGLNEMIFDDEDREKFNRGLKRAMEDGIDWDVTVEVAKAFGVDEDDVDVSGGGGHGSHHSYEGHVTIKNPGKDALSSTKLDAIKSKFKLKDQFVKSAQLEILKPEVNGDTAKIPVEVAVQFVEPEEDPQSDRDD